MARQQSSKLSGNYNPYVGSSPTGRTYVNFISYYRPNSYCRAYVRGNSL